jgi:hypothetical protein
LKLNLMYKIFMVIKKLLTCCAMQLYVGKQSVLYSSFFCECENLLINYKN